MITEDYVSFETAKLLKEKGFNEDSWFHYDTDGDIVTRGYRLNRPDDVPAWTLQMVMKWLRNVHNIDIDIKSYWKIKPKYHIHGYKYRLHYNNAPNHDINQRFNSYEEACEVAIKYCLKNLI